MRRPRGRFLRRRWAVLLAGTLLLPLTACGEQGDDYCATLASHRRELDTMTSADASTASALIDHLPLLRTLSDHAPSDLTDEWQTLVDALEGLDRAVRRSGHTLSDFEDKKVPTDLTTGQREAIVGAATQLESSQVTTAAKGIEQQARDVCKTNIGFY